jgi:DNA-binding transcriptional regulator PaaX
VLIVLWAGLLEHPGGESIQVHLAELRRVVDPSGSAVRAAGRRLSDAGVLHGSDRDAVGTFWEVPREGFARLLGAGVDPAELEVGARRWRELRGKPSEPP